MAPRCIQGSSHCIHFLKNQVMKNILLKARETNFKTDADSVCFPNYTLTCITKHILCDKKCKLTFFLQVRLIRFFVVSVLPCLLALTEIICLTIWLLHWRFWQQQRGGLPLRRLFQSIHTELLKSYMTEDAKKANLVKYLMVMEKVLSHGSNPYTICRVLKMYLLLCFVAVVII